MLYIVANLTSKFDSFSGNSNDALSAVVHACPIRLTQ